MIRGIERRPIFGDDTDREDLLRRIETLAETAAFSVYAWAFMPNHVHLLLRTGSLSLSRSMSSLLTGYAVRFNRRYERSGHLFQNRFKSVVCEEQAYLLELVRYIHLNPLRGGILGTLEQLDRYPFTGHSSLIGNWPRRWQRTEEVLEHFSNDPRAAVQT
ncbi:MAG: transposase, partial [Candidatus Binatia bacterium]